MPGQSGALYTYRKLRHASEYRQFADALVIHMPRRDEVMHFFKQHFHFGLGLDRLFREAGAAAASLVAHPGLSNTELQAVSVKETGGGLSQRFFLMLARTVGMSPGEGALSQLRAATDPGAEGGEFYGPLFVNSGAPVRKPVLRRLGMSRAIEKLWQVSERETGLELRP